MSGLEKLIDKQIDVQRRVDRLESTAQLGNSTISGEAALAVQSVVSEAAVTNDAMPIVQDDAADSNDGVTDLQDTLSTFDDDLAARLEDERAQLEDARVDLELSQQDIEDAFGHTVEGLSEDVDTAIRAAGAAKTEAEAASDAALAAAGLAASKGKTIVQVSAPTGANADPANLWINISPDSNGVPKNQPNRYNPDTAKWEPVTDAQTVAAAQAAANAAAAAQAAKDVADQANAAAGVAKTAADNANTAALQAAGIANGKGKVIYQASKPTGANAAAGNLWIRTSDNTPWAYDATIPDWVQVTDQTAKDAAAAAVLAQQAATAASNAAAAAQATADGKPLILFSTTSAPSGTAPTGSIWFLWDSAKNIAGQWLQSGTLANPVWTPQQIRSEVIANLDVGKLTAGSAAIADLVAQKIAASTANFQTVNVSNLFVTSGATLTQAVIDFLFANVVQAKKITAGMIDVSTLNGVAITGAILQTSASGKRVVLANNVLTFWGLSGSNAVPAGVIEGVPNGTDRGMLQFRSATDGTTSLLLGNQSLPVSGSVEAVADRMWVHELYVDNVWFAGTNTRVAGDATTWTTISTNGSYVGTGLSARRNGDLIVLQGQIATSSGNLPASVANVATIGGASFRPNQAQIFLVAGGSGFVGRVQIGTNGQIDVSVVAGSSSYIRLDNVVFYRTS
jgi:hypothetical protein